MQKELVSILTPCYNTGALVHRLLDSVLMQDYPQVEMFCIDDGSTDNTREVIESYIPKFTERGYILTYIYQENGGQSSAINNSLKLINGEFLTWPDSDDFFRKENSLSKMVQALHSYPDYGLCRCLTTYVEEESLVPLYSTNDNINFRKETLFEDCLYSQNEFLWGAGNYMARVSLLKESNPNLEIYTEKNAGQNWQMLLPLLYKFKCSPVPEQLFCVLVRKSSHSRGQCKTFEQAMAQFSAYKNTILSTLDSIAAMPNYEREQHKRNIIAKYKVQELQLSIQYGEKQAQSAIEKELRDLGVAVSSKQKFMWQIRRYYNGSLLLRRFNKIFK